MPDRETVRRWQAENDPFRSQYAIARDQQADALAEEAIHVARNARAGTASARRLQVDAIKWLTAKLAPKRYGEKVAPDPTAKAADRRRNRKGAGTGAADAGEVRASMERCPPKAEVVSSVLASAEGSLATATQKSELKE